MLGLKSKILGPKFDVPSNVCGTLRVNAASKTGEMPIVATKCHALPILNVLVGPSAAWGCRDSGNVRFM